MNAPIPVDFTNVVDEREQLPLDIDLGFGAEGKVVQTFLDAQIGKDRLHDRQSPGVDLPAFGCIDPGLHVFDQVGLQTAYLDGQEPVRSGGLAQAVGSQRASGTILWASAIDVIDPVAVALAAGSTLQELAMRTDIGLPEGIEAKIIIGELGFSFRGSCFAMNAILESRLFEEVGISFAELDVGDVSIQLLRLAECQIGQAIIVAVRSELFSLKVIGLLANGLHILFGTLQHGVQVVMILAATRLGVHDDLVLFIHPCLCVVPLDHPVRRGHLGGLVVGDIALDLFLPLPELRFFLLQELVQAFDLLQQLLFLVLVFVCFGVRYLILADVFVNDLLEFCLELVPFFLQLFERSAPLFGCGGRQLDPIQTKVCASQQMEFFTDQQDVGEQAPDLLLHRGDKMCQRAMIRMTATAERHEEHILTTGALDLTGTDDAS